MCGIVGVAGNLTATSDRVFKNLLVLDCLRGTDSTGIAAIDKTDEVRVVKQVGDPFNLMNMKPFDLAMAKMNRAIIGHNRYATQGNITRRNAHPFEFSNIIGVHNGTINNKYKLKDSKDFTVDSENLFHHLNDEGLNSLLEVLEGAWSLVWWNKEESSLNFLRNKERPMWMCEQENTRLLFWASEPWMLEAALSRDDKKFSQPFSTTPDTLYSFVVRNNGVIDKPILRNSPSKVVPYVYQRNFVGGNQKCAGNSSSQEQRRQQIVEAFKAEGKEVSVTPTGKVVEFPKSRATPLVLKKRVASDSSNLYLERKDVLIEALVLCNDGYGARYIACFDPENRGAKIRLYLKGTDIPEKYVGKDLLVSIGNKYTDGRDGFYYKVAYNSVRLHPNHIKENNEENERGFFYNSKKKLISRKEWNDKYKSCCFCTSPVFPEDANKFTVNGDIVCPDCCSDTQTVSYLNLQ